MKTSSVEDALSAIESGEMVVVVDDVGRENEGDLIMAADCATPEALAFMIRYTSGVVCVSLLPSRLEALQLPLMVANNAESQSTAFTITTDYRFGTSTGISAADRAATLRALADPKVDATAFVRPGHIFPLRARSGGVFERRGHTEAALDLARLAGRQPAGVLCELVNDDGTMMRPPELEIFAERHKMCLISVEQLVAYRRRIDATRESAAADSVVPRARGGFVNWLARGLHGPEPI